MVRIAIAEDDPAYRATLEEYLERYRRENGLEAEVTAFSDGLVSAVISFARTLVFLVGMLLTLPELLGELGIWLAVPAAEALGLAVAAAFLLWGRRKYGYGAPAAEKP